MNAAEITEFLTHLAVNGRVAASTQNQALNALVFLYKQVLRIDLDQIYLPHALERKHPNAAKEFGWQYLFPAGNLSIDPRSREQRRHHVSELNLQRAIKKAVAKAGITKNATSHSFVIASRPTCLKTAMTSGRRKNS